jgi:hypothetical protein
LAVAISLYLDENVPVAIAVELKKRGIDAVTVRDLGLLGDEAINHLSRATDMERVLCTHDSDYARLAADGIQHAGIVLGQQTKHGIGEWIKGLELICSVYTTEDMQNHVEYL